MGIVVRLDSNRSVTDGTSVPSSAGFAEYLTVSGKVSSDAISRAQQISQTSGEKLAIVLTRLGVITERERAEALAGYLDLQIAVAADYPEAAILRDRFSLKFLKDTQFLPISENAEDITVALIDPLDTYTLDAIRFAAGKPVLARVAYPEELEAAFRRLYAGENEARDHINETAGLSSEFAIADDIDRLKDMASDAPVIRLVNQLITQAVEARASDIHIEPLENELRIRFRIDGVLQKQPSPPQQLASAIVSRVKIMTKLNIAERRLPQDGRIGMAVRGKEIDLRVSTTPTSYGESVVLRILDREQVRLDFAALGFEDEIVGPLRGLFQEPHGILLVTGPTGSGKTTTLYAALTELNTVEKKILTIEDPVEYHLDGINQVQVKPQIGLTFAGALRSFLRQDPDIMMVGEIRDLETAEVAVQAALTGHLILSTLHTNDAASALTRLLDMGVEDYLLTSTVIGVVAQRLVRTLCPHCREAFEPVPEIWDRLGVLREDGARVLYRSNGCAECSHTGYKGRTAIIEILPITDPIRRALLETPDASKIQRLALDQGLQSMRTHGIRKARDGITTLDEVLRVTRAA
jgi:general secretion pathway protein E